MTRSVPGMREAYDASATAWAQGPASAYDVMADVLLATAATHLPGSRVLDIGTGTGAAARAARRAGASRVVGVDVAPEMLRVGSGWDSAVVADASRLPFANLGFDLVVAACCLGHLPDPLAALIEVRRVAPAIVASAFLNGWSHPAKSLVDGIAARYGFTVPDWYVRLKTDVEPELDDPVKLEALGMAAGFGCVEVTTHSVDVGLHSPSQLASWRLGMAHLAPFVASLPTSGRDGLRQQCEEALVGSPSLIVPLVVINAYDPP